LGSRDDKQNHQATRETGETGKTAFQKLRVRLRVRSKAGNDVVSGGRRSRISVKLNGSDRCFTGAAARSGRQV